MDPRRDDHVYELFCAAVDLPAVQRSAWLNTHCGDDPTLRAEVESLLSHHDTPVGFVETSMELPAGMHGRPAPLDDGTDDTPWSLTGRNVAGYAIEELIARGGAGAVYRGSHQASTGRDVAFKILRPGAFAPAALRRFEFEAQVLGRLRHPGIAQIHDAGTADLGDGRQPFFAMELIQGAPITTHTRQLALGVRDRLELLARVCDAVHHAHQHGVVHRDLKPGNILVEDDDAIGQPKILDFGVARVTDQDLRAESFATIAGQLVGTVPYMSPEQAAGDVDEIDIRSDVYSLGVIGYELLVGRLPHDLEGANLAEAVRIVREEEPPRLGTLDRSLRGDVETVIGKALAREKTRRYESAGAFAADLRRHLRYEPIEARPTGAVYHMMRFARRHRSLVASSVVGLILLVAGITGTTYGFLQARQGRDMAERALVRFLTMLESPRIEEDGPDARVIDLIDEAVMRLDDGEEPPPVEARLRTAMGRTYLSLGNAVSAVVQLERAERLATDDWGEGDPRTLQVRSLLGTALFDADRIDEAEQVLTRTLEAQRAANGERHRDTLDTRVALALVFKHHRDFEAAEREYVRVLADAPGIADIDERWVLARQQALATLYRASGRLDEAERLLRATLTEQRARFGAGDHHALATLSTLATTLRQMGNTTEALVLREESVQTTAETFGVDHPHHFKSLERYGALLSDLRRYDDARDTLQVAIEGLERVRGRGHRETVLTRRTLGQVERRAGHPDIAAAIYRDILPALDASFGERHPTSLGVRADLALALDKSGRDEDAEAMYRNVIALRREATGLDRATMNVIYNLGLFFVDRDRADEAEPLLAECGDAGLTRPDLRRSAILFLAGHAVCLVKLNRADDAQQRLAEMDALAREAGDRLSRRDRERIDAVRERVKAMPETVAGS